MDKALSGVITRDPALLASYTCLPPDHVHHQFGPRSIAHPTQHLTLDYLETLPAHHHVPDARQWSELAQTHSPRRRPISIPPPANGHPFAHSETQPLGPRQGQAGKKSPTAYETNEPSNDDRGPVSWRSVIAPSSNPQIRDRPRFRRYGSERAWQGPSANRDSLEPPPPTDALPDLAGTAAMMGGLGWLALKGKDWVVEGDSPCGWRKGLRGSWWLKTIGGNHHPDRRQVLHIFMPLVYTHTHSRLSEIPLSPSSGRLSIRLSLAGLPLPAAFRSPPPPAERPL